MEKMRRWRKKMMGECTGAPPELGGWAVAAAVVLLLLLVEEAGDKNVPTA